MAGEADGASVHARRTEAEETLRAIRSGEVDALVVHRGSSPVAQVFTLSSADRPYRMFVENMRDGAATVSTSGIVLYANRRLAELLAVPAHEIAGSPIAPFIACSDRAALLGISSCAGAGGTIDIELLTGGGSRIAVRVNSSPLELDGDELICLTFADLTEQNALLLEIDRLGAAQAARMRELEQAEVSLTEQATHDALTGLANRHLVIDRLTQTLALGQRSGALTGLIFIDLDHFKRVNDSRGHAAGDSVLRQVATRLLTAVRPMDSVARLGGDEFVVLLPALKSRHDAVTVGARISAVLDPPMVLDNGAIPVRASIGISVVDPAYEQGVHPDRLLQRADTAMYRAKSLGGSRTELFDAGSSILEADEDTWSTSIAPAS